MKNPIKAKINVPSSPVASTHIRDTSSILMMEATTTPPKINLATSIKNFANSFLISDSFAIQK